MLKAARGFVKETWNAKDSPACSESLLQIYTYIWQTFPINPSMASAKGL